MNKVLLELYKQAHVPGTATDPSNNMPYETTYFSAEKFAELIVMECVAFKDELSQFDRTDPFGDGYESGLNDLTETIREHFGI